MQEKRACGSCTLCCKVMAVYSNDPPMHKKPGVWCEHCEIGKSCRIYETKPNSCAQFRCMWLDNLWMPDEVRPDRSHVIFEGMEPAQAVIVMIDRQGAEMKPGVKMIIELLLKKGIAVALSRKHGSADVVVPDSRDKDEVMGKIEAYSQMMRESAKSDYGVDLEAS